MLDLGALINVMPTSNYKFLKFGDLEPTGMTIQLANRSVVQPLSILKDVLVQVNELIFSADFYVLDMEDETSGKGSTLILGRPFLMTARTKIDVHAETLSMEFGDHLVQLNIFEAMKHLTEDHSLFGIDLIDELVEEHLQLNADNDDTLDFARDTDIFDYLGSVTTETDCNELREVHDLSNSKDGIIDLADLGPEEEWLDLLNQVCKHEDLEYSNNAGEQEDKLLHVLRQHKKAIGWKLSDLLGINPSIYMHRILMEEEARPIRQQQRRLNLTILDVVKKEVTKLLVAGIVYPISNS
ncbi:hypothetical protein CR513_33397, partial [Mucuna pruriens]